MFYPVAQWCPFFSLFFGKGFPLKSTNPKRMRPFSPLDIHWTSGFTYSIQRMDGSRPCQVDSLSAASLAERPAARLFFPSLDLVPPSWAYGRAGSDFGLGICGILCLVPPVCLSVCWKARDGFCFLHLLLCDVSCFWTLISEGSFSSTSLCDDRYLLCIFGLAFVQKRIFKRPVALSIRTVSL